MRRCWRRRNLSQPGLRYGDNAWGIQFHGELTRAMMQRWWYAARIVSSCQARSPAATISAGRLIWDMHLKRWLDEFLQTIFGKPALR